MYARTPVRDMKVQLMERQAGLGRSLGDVLDSLTPVDADASAPGRVLFEPEDLEQQLDALMGDIRDLRERVQHLVGMVPGADLADGPSSKPLALVEQGLEQGAEQGVEQASGKAPKKGKKQKKSTKASKHKK
jgi:hypothetical protein